MAEKSLRQRYTETRSDYMGNEEKKSLAESGATFEVTQASLGESRFGPIVQLRIGDGEKVRWMTLSYTPTRSEWMDAVMEHVLEHGSAKFTLKRIELKDGNEFFDLVPAE